MGQPLLTQKQMQGKFNKCILQKYTLAGPSINNNCCLYFPDRDFI